MSYYLVVALDVHDPELFRRYQQQTAATLRSHHAVPRSVTPSPALLDGDVRADVVVLIEFADRASCDRWWNSPEYAEVKLLRERCATTRMVVGLPGVPDRPGAGHAPVPAEPEPAPGANS